MKYDFLAENSLKSISFNGFTPFKNSFLFKNIDETKLLKYNEGINPIDLFQVNVMGFQTHRDDFCIDDSKTHLANKLYKFSQNKNSEDEISKEFGVKSSTDFNIQKAQTELSKVDIEKEISKCNYRPFETKYIYFDKIVVDRPRKELLIHSKNKENIILGIGRQGMAVGDIQWCLTTVSKNPVDANMFRRGGVNLFPLYLYPETKGQQIIGQTTERTPNLNLEIVNQIAEKLGLTFVAEKHSPPLEGCLQGGVVNNTTLHKTPRPTDTPLKEGNFSQDITQEQTFAPIDILDYIYAVLHSPTYREKYKEFLKIDFPRVPYPKDVKTFWQLVKLGGEIRQIHLLESPTVEKYITQYPIDGNNVVGKIKFVPNSVAKNDDTIVSNTFDTSDNTTQHYSDNISFPQPHLGSNDSQQLHEPEFEYQRIIKGKVYINDTQYFDNVPEIAWKFYIGGYQPAQKWLKDRKERKLEFDDILHYQKIIVALSETDRLMKEIDKIEIE